MNKDKLKIGVYVLSKHAKANYANECYDVRINAGMAVVMDDLRRNGFTNIQFCGEANAYKFDMVMYSVTSDCDWWPFVAERVRWPSGDYKVVVGGTGCLNPRPFLGLVDYFVLGRCEGVQALVAQTILEGGGPVPSESVVSSCNYSLSRIYRINQVDECYPREVPLENGRTYKEEIIGCNHRCLFCGYTWHRKMVNCDVFYYTYQHGSAGADNERAIIDIANGADIDLNRLRTTAIDGMSERLRFMVNKRITREMFREFLRRLSTVDKPHEVKIYNIIGYPTETREDWHEYLEDIMLVDRDAPQREKQTLLLLHSTPFRPVPATPMACAPIAYENFRGAVKEELAPGQYYGKIYFRGRSFWGCESAGVESLATVFQTAIVWRGTERDQTAIIKLASSRKFAGANTATKVATMERYFDAARLFGSYTPEQLPTRNIRTYAQIEKTWGREPWR